MAVQDVIVSSQIGRLRALAGKITGEHRVWMLAVGIALAAGISGYSLRSVAPFPDARSMPVLVMAVLFYVGEVTVVHVKFKRNTQSFSMSEVPLVLGLFFVSPIGLLAAQFVGNAVALIANRRQPPVKLFFNLAQFSLVTVITIVIFRLIVGGSESVGPAGWVAAIAAVAVGNVLANGLVHQAIRISGGRLSRTQIIEVLSLSTAGAAVNASLALLAVTLIAVRPSAAWLALLPLVVLYGAYRAYVGQKQERYRLESLYEITRVLHASPQIDVAIEQAAVQTQIMFEAERVDLLLIDQSDHDRVFQTTVDSSGVVRTMAPVRLPTGHDLYDWLDGLEGPTALTDVPPIPNANLRSDDTMAAPVRSDTGLMGVIVAAEPLSDVGGFGTADVQQLAAVAGKISVSLQNGRMEDSLNQLTQLKERLEGQIRSKDQFIATVSHELRTPLTTVLGLSHELGERRTDFSEDEIEEVVSLIANESTELSNLIEDLLVGAREDVSTLATHRQVFAVSEELKTVVDGHAHRTGTRRVEIRCKADCGKACADPLRFRQIIRNLLTNAARYGGSDIWIEVSDVGDSVIIAVVDDGNGVHPRYAATIFEAYERGHESEPSMPGSVGLGLAVSRRLADLMGGSLQYRRAGGNTRFELSLPTGP